MELFKIRLLFIILLIAQISIIKGQSLTINSLDDNLEKSYNKFKEGNFDSSIIIIDKILELDTSCNDLFLIRGYFKLWNFNTYEESAIQDFATYISNRTSQKDQICHFNDTLLSFMSKGILNFEYPDLGDYGLTVSALSILNGIIAYFNPNRGDPCKFWDEMKINGDKNISILINKYCKNNLPPLKK